MYSASSSASSPDQSQPSDKPAEEKAPRQPKGIPVGVSGLDFGVADSIDDVLEAWHMVYCSYLDAELIGPNPHRMHTAMQAIGSHSVVILGKISEVVASTLTAMVDPPTGQGLPLDRVYHHELDQLRKSGRRLMEVGLFADRRKQLARSAEALFQLMRIAFYYGLDTRVTDFVIGVHPRHARFYVRSFGFEAHGEPKVYPAVNDRPVQLLRGDLEDRLARKPLHPALEYFVDNPIDQVVFNGRFMLDAESIAGTSIEAYLKDHAAPSAKEEQRLGRTA